MKRLLRIAGALVALLLIAVAAVSFFFDAGRFKPMLEEKLSGVLHRTVTIGTLRLALMSGGVSASDLSISEDPAYGKAPFLKAESLKIGVDLRALLFSRALHVQEFTVDRADVTLIQTGGGEWNFSTLGTDSAAPSEPKTPAPAAPAEASAPLDLEVKLVRITNSTLHLTNGRARHEFQDVNFELRDFSTTTAMPLSLAAKSGEGTVKLTGTAGPIAKENAADTPFDAKIEIDKLDLGASGFLDPASGIGGVLTVRGDVNSNGKTAAVSGAVTVDQLKLSPKGQPAEHPVGINIAVAHDLKARRGDIARSTLRLGSANATLKGTYDLAEADPTFTASLDGDNMPLQEILSFAPAADIQLPTGAKIEGGTVNLSVNAHGSAKNMVSTGSVKIANAKLTNYDLGTKLRVIQELARMPKETSTAIQLAAANFENSSAGTTVKDIDFNAPSIGQVTGAGTVSPNHQLDFKMKAAVKAGGVLAVMGQNGTATLPFAITGTSSDPSFKADVKAIAGDKLKQVMKDPNNAAKNTIDTVKGVMNLFKKAPQQPPGETNK